MPLPNRPGRSRRAATTTEGRLVDVSDQLSNYPTLPAFPRSQANPLYAASTASSTMPSYPDPSRPPSPSPTALPVVPCDSCGHARSGAPALHRRSGLGLSLLDLPQTPNHPDALIPDAPDLSQDPEQDVCFPHPADHPDAPPTTSAIDFDALATVIDAPPTPTSAPPLGLPWPYHDSTSATHSPRTSGEDDNGSALFLPEDSMHAGGYGAPMGQEAPAGTTGGIFRRRKNRPATPDPHARFMYHAPSVGTVYARELTQLTAPAPPLQSAATTSPNSCPMLALPDLLTQESFWIDITSPTESEMRAIAKIFRIHPLTTEDIMTEDTREKCELFKRYYFVSFQTYEQDPDRDDYLEPVPTYAVVMREGILTFHHRPTPHARNVLRRIRQLKDFISITPDWINYAIIDDITDAFAPLIQSIQLEVDTIDELVLILKESEQSDMLRRIGYARKKVMVALRLLSAKADVMRALIKRCEDWLAGDICLYLGDIQDHIITMLQNVNHFEKIVARSHTNYLAQISIELTQTSNDTNDVVAKLTVLASILVPMNVITGLWGMNVKVPGQDVENLNWFGGIVAFMIVLAVSLVLYLRRREIF